MELDKPLEDMIKETRAAKRHNRPKKPPQKQQQPPKKNISTADLDAAAGSKLLVSNLHFGVTESDLRVLYN